jgi:VWFA-related protein
VNHRLLRLAWGLRPRSAKNAGIQVLTPLVVATLATVGLAGQGQQPPRYTENVTVTRVLIDARVVDSYGQPIYGLNASRFKVRVDGKPARVESVEWIGGKGPGAAQSRRGASGAAAPLESSHGLSKAEHSPARLIVLLFQKDLEPSRIVGLMRMLIATHTFLDSLGPEDRVAVLSFDSRLRIWLDFTTSMDKVRDVLQRGILFQYPPRVEPVPPPALMTRLDVVRAGRASSMEDALALLGRALEPLPGAKSVALIGHGFGRRVAGRMQFEDSYGEARRALQAARASVFCLDVTDADLHSLDAGLQMTAEDTGGFFLRTHQFPGQAMSRLTGVLAGQYVLFVEVTAPVSRRVHDIEVELVGVRDGRVLAKRTFVGD